MPALLFVAAFSILAGLFGLAWGVVLASAGSVSWVAGLVGPETVRAWGGNALLAGLLSIGTGLLQVAAGFGLLFRQRWAWWLALVVTVLSLLNPLVGLANGDGGATLGLVFSALILVALLSPMARRAVRRTPAAPGAAPLPADGGRVEGGAQ